MGWQNGSFLGVYRRSPNQLFQTLLQAMLRIGRLQEASRR